MKHILSPSLNSMMAGAEQLIDPVPSSSLDRLKGLSFMPDGSAQLATAAYRSFEHYFEREAGRLASMIGPKGIASFARDVQSKFESIIKRAFDALPRNKTGSVAGKDFIAVMMGANKEATMALDRLKVDAARANFTSRLEAVDFRPQIIVKGGKLVVIRAAPPLENIVLRGGGAKGIGYSAALDQMEKAGVLSGLRHVAGSSAGALTAACLAAGLSAEQFEKGPADTLFRPGVLKALGGSDMLARVYPDLEMEGGLAPAVSSVKIIDETTARSVQGYLKEHWSTPAFQAKLSASTPEQVKRLETLRTLPDFDQPHKDNMITFGDLKMLNELAPEKFKQLTVTGWNKTDQREEYFDAVSTPDMPVAYATRISMAFPIVFKAVVLEENGQKKVYADGGIGSNMPAEIFEKGKSASGNLAPPTDIERAQQKARTLLMTFDEDGNAYQIMHSGPPKKEPVSLWGWVKSFFVNLITRHPDYNSASQEDKRKVWDAGPNAVPVFHGAIGTLSMNVSDAEQHQAHMLSAWKALEQIEVRAQQAYYMQYETLEQLASQLTDKEIQALRSAHDLDDQQRRLLAIVGQTERQYGIHIDNQAMFHGGAGFATV